MQANHTGRGIPDKVGGNEEIDHQVMQDLQRQSTRDSFTTYVHVCMVVWNLLIIICLLHVLSHLSKLHCYNHYSRQSFQFVWLPNQLAIC